MKREERKKMVEMNETSRLIKKIANDFGYESGHCYITSYGKPEVCIRPKDRSFHSFYPEIYLRGHWDLGMKQYVVEGFEIQTTSYGALCIGDYKEMLDKMNSALAMVQELNHVDFSGLTKLPEKFDDDEE